MIHQSLVHIAGSKSDQFAVRVGFHQGSLRFWTIFMDRISRCSQVVEGVRFIGLCSLLFADDVVLLTSSNNVLQVSLGWFAVECEAAGMRISTSKSEVYCGEERAEERAELVGKALNLWVNLCPNPHLGS